MYVKNNKIMLEKKSVLQSVIDAFLTGMHVLPPETSFPARISRQNHSEQN